MKRVSCISPIDNSVLVTRDYADNNKIKSILDKAKAAQIAWQGTKIKDRVDIIAKFVENMEAMNGEIVPELAKQMGRPVVFEGEMGPFKERSAYMSNIAPQALAPYIPDNDSEDNITRYIERVPLGVVLVIAPWNYPFITAVNGVVPALLAGNAVILKHATQTLLVGERFAEAMANSGMPDNVFNNVLIDHDQVADMLQSGLINHITFTGSVAGGKAIEKAAAGTFATMNLELGGKDAAYVCDDANLPLTVADLVSGAFFNAGQCCCGIERIYVHKAVFDDFLDLFVAETKKLKLGNPLDKSTTLGPMANIRFANTVRKQISDAIAAGAQPLIDRKLFPADDGKTAYLAPQVLINVNHSMDVMMEESFGPVVGIMKVDDDQTAVKLINDSYYGLTASIWTKQQQRASQIGRNIESGIVFMNRCDYVDPRLVWSGVKNTGRGASLSKYGFDALTRPKSYHLRRGNFC